MTSIKYLEEQVKQLSPTQRQEFREWFFEWDADDWDRQIDQDAKAGKLDAFAAEALAEYKSGKAKEIWNTMHQAGFGIVTVFFRNQYRNSPMKTISFFEVIPLIPPCVSKKWETVSIEVYASAWNIEHWVFLFQTVFNGFGSGIMRSMTVCLVD